MFTHARRKAGLKAAAGAVAAGVALAAAPAAHANSFYTPPADLPAENGALVKSEPMKLGASITVGLFFKKSLPGKATRIMYRTTDTNGQATAVTGTYIEPSARWTGGGPRPLITYAEGTQGQGDVCAPSYGLENPIGFNAGQVNVGYEVPSIYAFLLKGYGVVVTDYVGLGTPDRVHTYVNRLDQGRAVLDAARAASKVTGASVKTTSPVGAYGYSQGGGAAASAAELQPTYAPDVNLKGAYAGAPPADLTEVMQTADGTTLTAVIGYAVNGFVNTYPHLQPILDAETTPAGKAALSKIAGQCIGNSALSYAFQKTSSWTKSGKSISQITAETPAIQAVVDAQKIGNIKPNVPVRVSTGTKDDIVPHPQAKQLAQDWCNLGANVTYAPIFQLFGTGGTSVNHLAPMLQDAGAAQSWLGDRLSGKPNASNCSSVPRMQ